LGGLGDLGRPGRSWAAWATTRAPTRWPLKIRWSLPKAQGNSNRAIAAALFLTEATVKTHLVRIYRKLGTENRMGAVSKAVRRGSLDVD
jgi:hypothetical protein